MCCTNFYQIYNLVTGETSVILLTACHKKALLKISKSSNMSAVCDWMGDPHLIVLAFT